MTRNFGKRYLLAFIVLMLSLAFFYACGDDTASPVREIAYLRTIGDFKTEYAPFEELDLTGVELQVVYTDGSSTQVPVTINMVGTFSSDIVGAYKLYVYYFGNTTFYYYNVSDSTTYTVTFYDGDSVLDTQTIQYGHAASVPSTDKEGYTFNGWSTSFSYVTSNLNVRASYTIKTYTVTFTVRDYPDTFRYVEHGSALTDIPDIPEKEGYIGEWDVTDFSCITGNMQVTAVYVPE